MEKVDEADQSVAEKPQRAGKGTDCQGTFFIPGQMNSVARMLTKLLSPDELQDLLAELDSNPDFPETLSAEFTRVYPFRAKDEAPLAGEESEGPGKCPVCSKEMVGCPACGELFCPRTSTATGGS